MPANFQLCGQVGPDGPFNDGTSPQIYFGVTGEPELSDAHAAYQEQNLRRAIFSGGVNGRTTTVGLATTYTGLCLSNTIGSPVNLALIKIGFGFTVAFTAASVVGLMTGYSPTTNVTHTTPVVPRSQYFSGVGGSAGLLDQAATLPVAPTLNTFLGYGLTGLITTQQQTNLSFIDVDGSIIVPPGGYVAFYTSTASGTNSGQFSMTWEEIPI